METYQFYLTVGIVLVGLEIVVPGFVLAPLGVAAMATAGVAYFSGSAIFQALTFAAVSAGLFVSLRSWNKSRLAAPKEQGTFGLVGQSGLLVEPPSSPALPGRVKVFSDEFELLWEDTPEFEDLKQLEPGQRIRVIRVLGNRVSVRRH
jgi:membrane protein implicated in regulation of membrane protease activity